MAGDIDMKHEESTDFADAPGSQRLLDAALDHALAQALRAPAIPANFRGQLDAALARAAVDESAARTRLERERRERQAELEAGYVRLRRETLRMLVGGAFVAGAASVLLLPWFNATFGAHAALAISAAGALTGLAIAMASWLRRAGASSPLDLLG
jgi:hypothetical protein